MPQPGAFHKAIRKDGLFFGPAESIHGQSAGFALRLNPTR